MEFRSMRRSRQLLTPEQAWALLEKGSYGVLAVQGDGGWPYAVAEVFIFTVQKRAINWMPCARIRRCASLWWINQIS